MMMLSNTNSQTHTRRFDTGLMEVCGVRPRHDIHVGMYGVLLPSLLFNATAGWGFMGCYTDSAGRVLPVSLANVASLSACQQAASSAGYSYFGLEDGNQCWAGNNIQIATSLGPSSSCNMPCSDGSDMCGGQWALNMYGPSEWQGPHTHAITRADA